jgi:hypothetical protein
MHPLSVQVACLIVSVDRVWWEEEQICWEDDWTQGYQNSNFDLIWHSLASFSSISTHIPEVFVDVVVTVIL